MIKVLLWDIDGTLLNFLAAEKAAMELRQKQGVREFMIAQNELSRAMARLKYKNHTIQ